MGLLLLAQKAMLLLPEGARNLKWVYIILLTVLGSLHISHMERSYIISSQRVVLGMAIVTPIEIDSLEDFCMLGGNYLERTLYDKSKICLPEVKEFFYDRMGGDRLKGRPKG